MKGIAAIFSLLLMFSCSSKIKNVIQDDNQNKNIDVKVGWVDPDTYVVIVIAENETVAVKKAKHKILKDIVSVRLRNNSRYSDIVKIQEEFKKPLQEGRITRSRNVKEGIEIAYQIRDSGLKEKFERK